MNTTRQPDIAETAASQIAFKASSERGSINTRLQHMQETHEHLLAEKEQIFVERSQRQDHLTGIQATLAEMHHKRQEAENYANVAMGTLGEQEAVRRVTGLQPALHMHANHVDDIAQHYAELEAQAENRLQAIDEELAAISQEGQEKRARLLVIDSAERQALAELGESIHARLLEELRVFDEELAALKQQQTVTAIARQQFTERATQELKDWPHLSQHYTPSFVDDQNSRMLSAYIAFLQECLKHEGHSLHYIYSLKSIRNSGMPWPSMFNLSAEDFQEMHPQARKPLPGRGLAGKLYYAQNILEEYKRAPK